MIIDRHGVCKHKVNDFSYSNMKMHAFVMRITQLRFFFTSKGEIQKFKSIPLNVSNFVFVIGNNKIHILVLNKNAFTHLFEFYYIKNSIYIKTVFMSCFSLFLLYFLQFLLELMELKFLNSSYGYLMTLWSQLMDNNNISMYLPILNKSIKIQIK